MGKQTQTPSAGSYGDWPGGPSSTIDAHSSRVNKLAYKRASLAARKWAKTRGKSPIRATKALSEATRLEADFQTGRGSHGQAQITRGLNGLTDRLTTGNRAGRTTHGGDYFTAKGSFVQNFGQQFGDKDPWVIRPKLPKGTFKSPKGAVSTAKILGKIL